MSERVYALMSTFPAGKEGYAAFLASACTASGKNEGTVKGYVRAIEVRDGLTKGQREKAANLPVDSMLSLVPGKDFGTPEQTRLLDWIVKNDTTNTKEIRDHKRTITGKNKDKRSTPDAAAKTVKLAEKLREAVEGFIAHGHNPLAMQVGAQLAQDYSGDVASAIAFVANNPAPVAEVTEPVAA